MKEFRNCRGSTEGRERVRENVEFNPTYRVEDQSCPIKREVTQEFCMICLPISTCYPWYPGMGEFSYDIEQDVNEACFFLFPARYPMWITSHDNPCEVNL